MESCSTQIGRKTEQLRLLEEEILSLEKRISEIELEIEKLYEKHNVSKEKADFIQECDAIASVLNQFIVRLRKNKVHLLQEKTFDMYRLLSSRSGLIKDIIIDDKTYEVRISDRNGHEIRKSSFRLTPRSTKTITGHSNRDSAEQQALSSIRGRN